MPPLTRLHFYNAGQRYSHGWCLNEKNWKTRRRKSGMISDVGVVYSLAYFRSISWMIERSFLTPFLICSSSDSLSFWLTRCVMPFSPMTAGMLMNTSSKMPFQPSGSVPTVNTVRCIHRHHTSCTACVPVATVIIARRCTYAYIVWPNSAWWLVTYVEGACFYGVRHASAFVQMRAAIALFLVGAETRSHVDRAMSVLLNSGVNRIW